MSSQATPLPLARMLGLLGVLLVGVSAPARSAPDKEIEAPPAPKAATTDRQAYVRFQELARGLLPADPARAFAFKGRILRDGDHAGTWAMQAKADGKAGDWRIEEIIRIDGQFVARRKSLLSKSLYPIHGSAIVRRDAGTARLAWSGAGDQLVFRHEADAGNARPTRRRFGAVAVSGLAPYVLVSAALRARGGRFRTFHVYDGVDGPPQLAARDLHVERGRQWRGHIADVLAFARPWPATLALHAKTGALLGFRVPTKQGLLEVVPFAPTEESASAWDLLTARSTTPALAALRFLYALERGYLTLAESLVSWPARVDPKATPRRPWIEARRIELLADLPPSRAAQTLQALLPRLTTRMVKIDEEEAQVDLPAPYAGWTIVCRRTAGETWLVRSTRYEQPPEDR